VITWTGLCLLQPQLRQYERDAKSIAAHEHWPWYCKWIGGFQDLRADLADVAAQHHLDPQEVRNVALAALKDAYRVARARQERRTPGAACPRAIPTKPME
jgi:hypothetical protein